MNSHQIAVWGVELSPFEAESIFRVLNVTQHRQAISFQTFSEERLADALTSLHDRRAAPVLIFFNETLKQLRKHLQEFVSSPLIGHAFIVGSGGRVHFGDLTFGRAPSGVRLSAIDLTDISNNESIEQILLSTLQRRKHALSLSKINNQLHTFHEERSVWEHQRSISDFYLSSFLSHATDAFIALDVTLRVLYWSEGASQLFSLSSEEAIGKSAIELPFWNESLTRQLQSIAAGEIATEVPFSYTKSWSGSTAMLEAMNSTVRDVGGELIGFSSIIRNVTERERKIESERAVQHRTLRVLESAHLHLQNIFKQAPGFVAVTAGSNHIFELANDAYLKIVDGHAIIGKPAKEALPELQGQEFLTLLDKVFQTGEAFVGRTIPVTNQRGDGRFETRFVDFVFHPIVEVEGAVTGIFCLGSDITEHKLAQEQLASHQEKLERAVEERTQELLKSEHALHQSQKLEAIGKLTGGIAHDFNNVMQIISSSLQLMKLSRDEEKFRYFRLAEDAVNRASKLSSDLLTFARKHPLSPVVVNLGGVLREMDSLLRHALGETIEIETVVGGGLWNTFVDVHQLENVILNLCINARDAMPSGGKLTLEAGNASLDYHYVQNEPGLAEGQYVLLAITDTGIGMTADIIAQAFDPFFTTKKEGEGTGLGLSMAYGFTKQTGGHIKIYSEVGEGTTFKIYLPRSMEIESALPARYDGPIVGGHEVILVVEDDPGVRETAVHMLSQLGYTVLQAIDGKSALEIVASGIAIDFIFTDVVMPGPVPCTELVAKAREKLPEIAVLFTSGYTRNAIVHGGRLDPGIELLNKPYSRALLAGRVRQLLDARMKNKESENDVPPLSNLRVLVVEDNDDSRDTMCQVLEILNHIYLGVVCAEDALVALEKDQWDFVITDVGLPGMPGNVLAQHIQSNWPAVKIVISSGYGGNIENIPDKCSILPKPYLIEHLVAVLK